MLLLAQVVFKKLVPSDVACVYARNRVVHQKLGLDLGHTGSGRNGSEYSSKIIAPLREFISIRLGFGEMSRRALGWEHHSVACDGNISLPKRIARTRERTISRESQAGLITVPGPTLDGMHVAQMLSFSGAKQVIPQPSTNNQNPMTCRHASLQSPPQPIADRKGVSTSAFLDAKVDDSRIIEIVKIIADPKQSHFFNTDCVSCHTETAQPLARNVKNFTVPGVSNAVWPKENWNVRNFGRFPSFLHGGIAPTITRRTAAETAEVVSFVNNQLLNK